METYPRPATITGNLTLQPVYNSTEKLKKFSLDSKGIQKMQALVIEQCLHEIKETIPAYILEKYRMVNRREALLNIHFPKDTTALQNAERRLKFEELFFIQLQLLSNKQFRELKFKGHLFSTVGERVNTFYNDILPFALTGAQKRVIKEIRTDTQRGIQITVWYRGMWEVEKL
ncbi:hypothetical protein [Pedobacter sp. NJ-S-72]